MIFSLVSYSEFATVALLDDAQEANLSRGQAGAVVHTLDSNTVLVEFSDDTGAACAMAPLNKALLWPLVYEARAA